MAAGVMSEGILIIASVIVATLIAGVVMSQVGVFESTFKATTEGQKDIMLTKIKIVYATETGTTNQNVSIWVKNIGINPILSANNTDVYFGEINSVQRIPHRTQVVGNPDCEVPVFPACEDTWRFDKPEPTPAWQIMDTFSINITDTDITPGVTYVVNIITPNGVTDEHVFTLPT